MSTDRPFRTAARLVLPATSSESASSPPLDEEPAGDDRFTTSLERFLVEPPDPEPYLVDGFVPRIGTGLLTSDPSLGKSTLAKQIAAHVAAGRDIDFLGWRVPQRVAVLYLLLEGSRDRDRVRTEVMLATCGIDPIGLPFRVRRARVRPTLDSRDFRAALEEAAPALLVLDTFPRFVPGYDENQAKEWKARVLDPLEALEEQLGFFALLVHHHGKPNDQRSGAHKTRGTSAMHGDVNLHLRLEAPDGKRSPRRQLFIDKVKEGEDVDPIELHFDKPHAVFSRADATEPTLPREVRQDMAKAAAKVFSALRDAEGELSQNAIENIAKGRRDRVRETLDVLRLWGALHRRAGQRGALMFSLASDFQTSKERRETLLSALADPAKPLPKERP